MIRQQIQIFEKLQAQLILKMASEVKKMQDMVKFCQAHPSDQKYKHKYQQLQQRHDEYQRQYEYIVQQVTQLRTLLWRLMRDKD